jgi:hypothetical protein
MAAVPISVIRPGSCKPTVPVRAAAKPQTDGPIAQNRTRLLTSFVHLGCRKSELVVELRPIHVLLLDAGNAEIAVLEHDGGVGGKLVSDARLVL